ncbi:MAG TPA: T9SS type A sorting domain-containing protein [Flavobacteriales bacterium]|nr:T9SS type A sorting domain-containing protein [Flavobacteriales bacterium]HMR26156.1 T9SS type A sorting domain-containing protein [Flavobacteriales bacterium]
MARDILLPFSVVLAMGASAQDLQRGEYFLDVDPGFGNGTPVTFAQAQEVSLPVSVDVSALAPGPHVLGVRMIDDAGDWGLTNRRYFMVRSMATGGDIVRFEHFLDTDPGFGNATALPAGPAPEVSGLLMDVLTDGLSAGPHTLFVRSLSSTGAWSLTNAQVFNVAVGIEELNAWGIMAGPSPLRDELVLQRNSGNEVIDIGLIDAQGRGLQGTRWLGDRLVLPVHALAAGNYLLVLRSSERAPLVLKLLKE